LDLSSAVAACRSRALRSIVRAGTVPFILHPIAMRPQQWEYKSIVIDVAGWLGPDVKPETIDTALDANGREGWELVNAFDVNTGHGRTTAIVAIFKRPRN
jgi:hypothetical protein